MTIEEYKQRLDLIKKEYDDRYTQLLRECAYENNPYQIGDIIQDHYHIIKIETMMWQKSYLDKLPGMVYRGTELKKDLTPKKRQSDTIIYQTNVIRKLN